jgi:dTMP kinase
VCFFLDVSEEAAARRGGGYGEEKYETREVQRRVREEFARLLARERNVVTVDAGRDAGEVGREMAEVFGTVVRRIEEEPGELGRVV